MTTAQELQAKVEEAKKGMEEELVKQISEFIKGVAVEASVTLDLNSIQVRIIEEDKGDGFITIRKSAFNRNVLKDGVDRVMGSYCNVLHLDPAGEIVGTSTKTAVFSYQLISMIYQVIEKFWESKQPEKSEESEDKVEKTPAS